MTLMFLVDIGVYCHDRTTNDALVSLDGVEQGAVRLSLDDVTLEGDGPVCTVTLPEALAIETGLMAGPVLVCPGPADMMLEMARIVAGHDRIARDPGRPAFVTEVLRTLHEVSQLETKLVETELGWLFSWRGVTGPYAPDPQDAVEGWVAAVTAGATP